MNTNKKILLAICCLVTLNLNAQLSTYEQPYGLKTDLNKSFQDYIVLHAPNLTNIEEEDLINDQLQGAVRYAYPVHVNYTLENSGVWHQLEDGSKLWQLKVTIPYALSTNTYYDDFWLPEGAKFFVYSEDTKQSIGAITSDFVGGSKEKPIEFATAIIYGENVVYEYYHPAYIKEEPIITINRIDYGYRYINNPFSSNLRGFGDSGDCQVNINCIPEGDNWQMEKHAVARVSIKFPLGTGWCSCALINNTSNDNTPYILTANHCLREPIFPFDYNYDAIENPDMQQSVFYWEYECPGCTNGLTEPVLLTTTGATVVANSTYGPNMIADIDFALLKLNVTQDPKNIPGVTPYYLGWDYSVNPDINSGVGIHHPKGDVKKISTYSQPLQTHNLYYFQWKVYFTETPNGFSVPEANSSGSPLINNNRYVIGHLKSSNNNNPCLEPEDAFYGYSKFHYSWFGFENIPERRLKDWLDPLNLNPTTLDGTGIWPCFPTPSVPIIYSKTINSNTIWNSDIAVHGTITIKSGFTLTIQNSTALFTEISSIVVQPGGKLVVNDGTLTNACLGKLWQGIELMGTTDTPQSPSNQGSVILNNATIENARIAINAYLKLTTPVIKKGGGIIEATGSNFINNAQSVLYQNYENKNLSGDIIDNLGFFRQCHFTIDQNNYFATSGVTFGCHVKMDGVRGIKFYGCHFENLSNTVSYSSGVGISANNSGFLVTSHCIRTPINNCPCTNGGNKSVFTFLSTGIAITGSSYNSYNVVIDQCEFFNVSNGASIGGTPNVQFSRNNVMYFINSGIKIDNASNFKIEENYFESDYSLNMGISLYSYSYITSPNLIYKNMFQNCKYGVYVNGVYYDPYNRTGLEIKCNEFNNCNRDIYLTHGSMISTNQGSISAGADNCFNGTLYSSMHFENIQNGWYINYYHSNKLCYIPYNPIFNYTTIYNNATANTCLSSFCKKIVGVKNNLQTDIELYSRLQQDRDNLLNEFSELGYDYVLANKENEEFPEELIIEALHFSCIIHELNNEMHELSDNSIRFIVEDIILNIEALKSWYEVIREPFAKYLLAETRLFTNDYEGADAILYEIPTMFQFSEIEMAEHNNYIQFHNFKKQLQIEERHWLNLNEREISYLQTIAEVNTGRSSVMAKGILCFFFDICYDHLPPTPSKGGGETRNNDTLNPIPETLNEFGLTIYPNPANTEITVSISSSKVSIDKVELFDVFGQVLLRQEINKSQGIVPTRNISDGIYIIKVYFSNGIVENNKIIIKK